VHVATMSQSQRVMRWRLILEEFGPDIRHISGEDNVVADAISRLPTATQDQIENCTDTQDPWGENDITAEAFILDDNETFPLQLSLVQKEQQKELNKNNSKLKQAINDKKIRIQCVYN
jgi:uncharacterized protein YlaN (UPF0358 family)